MANPTHPNRQKNRQTNETAAAIDHRYISFVRNCSKMDSTPHPKKMFVRKLIGLTCLTIGSISLYQLHHTKSIDSNIGYGTIPLFSAAILTPLQTCLGVWVKKAFRRTIREAKETKRSIVFVTIQFIRNDPAGLKLFNLIVGSVLTATLLVHLFLTKTAT